jgi:hypothetical protein
VTAEPAPPTGRGEVARVRRTGIALVHEGELVLPAPGSEAELDALLVGGQTVVYHFPVEIEVTTGGGTYDLDAIVDAAMTRIAARLENR